jgi:hypothetical protein
LPRRINFFRVKIVDTTCDSNYRVPCNKRNLAALLYTSNKPVNVEGDVAVLKLWKGEGSLLI